MSKILENALADARALHRAGAVDDITLREIEGLCLPPVKSYTAEDVRRIRATARMSQAVFARVMGVETVTVQKWEQGAKRPSGSSRRLLQVVETKGVEVLTGSVLKGPARTGVDDGGAEAGEAGWREERNRLRKVERQAAQEDMPGLKMLDVYAVKSLLPTWRAWEAFRCVRSLGKDIDLFHETSSKRERKARTTSLAWR